MQLPEDLRQAIAHIAKQVIKRALTKTKGKDGFLPYMTKTETTKYLHIAPKTLIDWEKHCNDIPAIKIEGVTRYQRASLDRWV